MKLIEVKEMLESTGLPVAYRAFPEGKAPKLPFIVYLSTGTDNFAADGKVYHEVKTIHVELYTETKSEELEKILEKAFDEWELFWNKSEEYLDTEKCYEILYEMEV